MCGICGLVYRDPRRQADPEQLRRMADTMRHRGPDDRGVEILGQTGLAHRRLSIIDLSPAGHQPMSNEDGTLWIVFNGEIYNFRELRSQLRHEHEFRSNSDTEILLHLYEERGRDMLSLLDGMFAFALYDHKKKTLLLARDPFGVKPLFYSWDQTRFVFGSELKPLLVSGEVERTLDRSALNDYFDFLWIPAPRTIFRDAKKLPHAHYLMLDVSKWELNLNEYWRPRYEPEYGRSLDDWSEEVSHELQSSVQRQLVSDVPLGTFLSGGIDSSLVTYHAHQTVGSGLKTFSIDFDDDMASEADSARHVVDTLSTDAVFRTLSHESLDRLAELAEFYDEPFADSSLLPTCAVSRVARERVTVALSGDGGDELYAGYRHYGMASWISRLDVIPNLLSSRLFQAAGILAPSDTRVGEWCRRLSLQPDYRRLAITRLPHRGRRTEVLATDVREPEEARFWFLENCLGRLQGLPPITQIQMFDLLFYLPNDMLVKVDRASMACSLETRVPLLTPSLANLAFRIPEETRFDADNLKPVLRSLMAKHFGAESARKPKHGFSIPRQSWLTKAASPEAEAEVINGAAVSSPYLERAAVQRLFSDVRRGGGRWRVDRTEELFAMFAFHAWWNRHML